MDGYSESIIQDVAFPVNRTEPALVTVFEVPETDSLQISAEWDQNQLIRYRREDKIKFIKQSFLRVWISPALATATLNSPRERKIFSEKQGQIGLIACPLVQMMLGFVPVRMLINCVNCGSYAKAQTERCSRRRAPARKTTSRPSGSDVEHFS